MKEVVVLYTNKFQYFYPEDKETMKGHPIEGRVYRAIKDTDTNHYLLHIGTENTESKMEGIQLKKLEGKSLGWECDLEEITDKNLLDFDLTPEDAEKMIQWETKGHDDLNKFINEPDEESGKEFDIEDIEDLVDLNHEMEIADALNKTLDYDAEFHFTMTDLIKYLASTCDDKYGSSQLDTRGILYSETLGQGFNTGNAVKYIARYNTEGFEKSYNPKDLMKAIHYLLFELTRRKING